MVAQGAGFDTVEPLSVCHERVPVHGAVAPAIAAIPVFHHQHQAWGGWPAARLTAPRVASVHRRDHKCKCKSEEEGLLAA